jgi:hypothetical protein
MSVRSYEKPVGINSEHEATSGQDDEADKTGRRLRNALHDVESTGEGCVGYVSGYWNSTRAYIASYYGPV